MQEQTREIVIGILLIMSSIVLFMISMDGKRIGNDNGSVKLFLMAITALIVGFYFIFR
jgi:hypothetical protein